MRPPSAEQLATADYGTRVTKEEAERMIVEYQKPLLLDPGSAIWRFATGDPTPEWMSDHLGNFYYGWGTRYSINAKNSYGGYAGETQFLVMFYQGKMFRRSEENRSKTDFYPNIRVFAPYPAALGR